MANREKIWRSSEFPWYKRTMHVQATNVGALGEGSRAWTEVADDMIGPWTTNSGLAQHRVLRVVHAVMFGSDERNQIL
jgi:hypothetical protein